MRDGDMACIRSQLRSPEVLQQRKLLEKGHGWVLCLVLKQEDQHCEAFQGSQGPPELSGLLATFVLALHP